MSREEIQVGRRSLRGSCPSRLRPVLLRFARLRAFVQANSRRRTAAHSKPERLFPQQALTAAARMRAIGSLGEPDSQRSRHTLRGKCKVRKVGIGGAIVLAMALALARGCWQRAMPRPMGEGSNDAVATTIGVRARATAIGIAGAASVSPTAAGHDRGCIEG